MSITLAPELTITDASDDDLFHITCCDEDRALCGKDVTDYPYTDGSEEWACVVCSDLQDAKCNAECDW